MEGIVVALDEGAYAHGGRGEVISDRLREGIHGLGEELEQVEQSFLGAEARFPDRLSRVDFVERF